MGLRKGLRNIHRKAQEYDLHFDDVSFAIDIEKDRHVLKVRRICQIASWDFFFCFTGEKVGVASLAEILCQGGRQVSWSQL